MVNPDLENGEENPYDFIFSKDKTGAPVPNGKMPTRNLFSKQYLVFGLFAAGVLIVAGIVASIIFKKDPPTAPELVRVSSFQSEILRVAEVGNKNDHGFEFSKDVDSLTLVILTDTRRVATLISAREVIPTKASLAQILDTRRDEQLAASLQVDTHSIVYEEIMDALVAGYYNSIKAAESAAISDTERGQLSAIRKNVEIIYLDDQQTTEETQTEEPTEEPTTPVITN